MTKKRVETYWGNGSSRKGPQVIILQYHFLVTSQFKLLSVKDFEQGSPSDGRATEQRCDK